MPDASILELLQINLSKILIFLMQIIKGIDVCQVL